MKTAHQILFRDLVEYLKSEKRSLKSILIYALTSGLVILMIPFIVQILLQQYSLLVFQESSLFLLILVTLFFVGVTTMRIVQTHIGEYLQRRIFVTSIHKLKKHAMALKTSNTAFKPRQWNYIFESISLQKTLTPLLFEGFTFILQFVLVLTLISVYHPFFVIYSLVLAFAVYWIAVQMGVKNFRFSQVESGKKYDVLDILGNWKGEDPQGDEALLESTLTDYFRARDRKYKYYIKQSIALYVVKILAAVVLLSMGGFLVLNNRMTIGQLVAGELIITNLLISLFKLTSLFDYLYDSLISFDKLKNFAGGLSKPEVTHEP